MLGFSVEEMRGMTTGDMIAFTDIANEHHDASEPEVREATQADIDALLG